MTVTRRRSQPPAAPVDASFRPAPDACPGRLRCVVLALVILSIPLVAAARADRSDGIAPSPGHAPAAGEAPAPGDHRLRMRWGGNERTFKVHVPPAYDGKARLPLVVAMHPYPGDADVIAGLSGLDAKADREGFLVLYPEGLGGGMNALACCGSQDDVGFVKALVERMVASWRADPRRVYATGISNGGDMAFRLAVEASDVFAAIAPVSGGFIGSKAASAAYRPRQPVSVVTFIGGKDRFYGQFDDGLRTWQKRMDCRPGAVAGPVRRGRVTHATFECADGSTMSVYRLPGMGHAWPGAGGGSLAAPGAGVEATDLIWRFFEQVHRP